MLPPGTERDNWIGSDVNDKTVSRGGFGEFCVVRALDCPIWRNNSGHI